MINPENFITLRIPKETYDSLVLFAHYNEISINQAILYCLTVAACFQNTVKTITNKNKNISIQKRKNTNLGEAFKRKTLRVPSSMFKIFKLSFPDLFPKNQWIIALIRYGLNEVNHVNPSNLHATFVKKAINQNIQNNWGSFTEIFDKKVIILPM